MAVILDSDVSWDYKKTSLEEILNDISENQNLNFYPNPSQDYITIMNNIEWSVLNVYDVRGQLLNTIEKTKDNQISVKNLMPGQYLLRVQSENHVYTAKFTKI